MPEGNKPPRLKNTESKPPPLLRFTKRDQNGRIVFFPFGCWGKGYIIPEDRYERTKNNILFIQFVILIILIFIKFSGDSLFESFAYVYVLFAIFLIYYLCMKWLLRSFDVSDLTYQAEDAARHALMLYSLSYIRLAKWSSLLLMALSLILIYIIFVEGEYFLIPLAALLLVGGHWVYKTSRLALAMAANDKRSTKN